MGVWSVIHRYHLGDVLLACAFYIASIIIAVQFEPHCRRFQWDDPRINNPPHVDTFPVSSLVVMVFVTPFVYVLCECVLVKPLRRVVSRCRHRPVAHDAMSVPTRPPPPSYGGSGSHTDAILVQDDSDRRSNADADPVGTATVAYAWVRTHMFAVGLQAIVIDVLKLYCGRLRPDYISRLRVAGFTATLKGIPDPMQDPAFYCDLMKEYPTLKEGRLSFPSGHSGISFSVFVVVTFYVFSHLRPFAFQGSFCRLCLSLLPMTVPLFCAASRTRDNKHHFSDVVAGSVIGAVAGVIAFKCCFRTTGGPMEAVRARVEDDVEYMHWKGRAPQELAGISEGELNADAATVAWGHGNSTPMRFIALATWLVLGTLVALVMLAQAGDAGGTTAPSVDPLVPQDIGKRTNKHVKVTFGVVVAVMTVVYIGMAAIAGFLFIWMYPKWITGRKSRRER